MSALTASTLLGKEVFNSSGEALGEIKELVLELESGRVDYALLQFGGFLGFGGKFFAVPLTALAVDEFSQRMIFDVPKSRLESAPGFDRQHAPDLSEHGMHQMIHAYYSLVSH